MSGGEDSEREPDAAPAGDAAALLAPQLASLFAPVTGPAKAPPAPEPGRAPERDPDPAHERDAGRADRGVQARAGAPPSGAAALAADPWAPPTSRAKPAAPATPAPATPAPATPVGPPPAVAGYGQPALVTAPVPRGPSVAVSAADPAGERFQPIPAALLVDAWYGRGGTAVSGEGLAIVAPEATPVHAVAAGTVAARPAADAVELRGDGGRRYRYGHLRAGSITVRQGQRIDAGSIIGAVDGGPDDPACLHLAVLDPDGSPINPYELLLGLADPNELGYQASGLGVGVDPEAIDVSLGEARPGASFAAVAATARTAPPTAGDGGGVAVPARPTAGTPPGGASRQPPHPTPDSGSGGTAVASDPAAAYLLAGAPPAAPTGAPPGAGSPGGTARATPPADPPAGSRSDPPAAPGPPVDRRAAVEPEPEPDPPPADEPPEPAVDQALLASLLAPGAPSAPPSRPPGQGRGRH
jgi:murein DD-endopeptidase MepM/ murein hydrolase activator NlpD